MKSKCPLGLSASLALALLQLQSFTALAQSSAFTFQGRLNDSGQPATGLYDLRFTIYDALTSGTVRGGPVSKPATLVTNGLFTVALDFGAAAFDGGDRWLNIEAGTNGAPALTPLSPRQPLTATPYAVRSASAGTAATANLANTVAAGSVSGSALQTGAVDSAKIADNTIAVADLSPTVRSNVFWRQDGNRGTSPGSQFLGTTDNQPLAFRVNNTEALRLSPSNTGPRLRLTGPGGSSARITLELATYDPGTNAPAAALVASDNNWSADLVLATKGPGNNTNALTPRLTVRNDGYVGIGTTNPLTALHVAGTVTADAFSGGGAGLTNVPGTVAWQNTSSNYLPAELNQSYRVTGANPTVFSLPTSAATGEVVRVSGLGSGGWQVAPVGTQVLQGGVPGEVWVPHNPSASWRSVASSADGLKLVAAASGGQIQTSTDAGNTWTARESIRPWQAVASSADGVKLLAAAYGGRLYVSANAGVTWTPRLGDTNWQSVASSADGTRLIAAVYQGLIYTSADSGATWTPRAFPTNWYSVACSADGRYLAAVVAGEKIWTSDDYGVTWVKHESDRSWRAIASSADGIHLAAVAQGGQIYTSADSGATWTPRETSREWKHLASSADGQRLVALEYPGRIHTSADAGVTWTPHESSRAWIAAASSADGTRLVALVDGGQVFTSAPGLSGAQGETVELQYLGGGQWQQVQPAFTRLEVHGPLTAASFTGDGAALTGLNANELAAGTVPDARLGANVARLDANQTFSGSNIFNERVGIGTNNPQSTLHVQGVVSAVTFGGIGTNAVEFHVNGMRTLRLEDNGDSAADPDSLSDGAPNVIAGSPGNYVAPRVVGATIAGGGATNFSGDAYVNAVSGNYGVVVGGWKNIAGPWAAVVCGAENRADGLLSTVCGGHRSAAIGYLSFAAGRRARATHDGSFVWCDSLDLDGGSQGVNSFTARASGGFFFYTSGGNTGAQLLAGSGSWTSMSDRHAKENYAEVSSREILEKVAALPVQTWNYKSQDAAIRHIGPTAQDFMAAFHVGETNTGITSVDADGVALAAIQGLNEKVESGKQKAESRMEKLEQRNAKLEKELAALRQLVERLNTQLNGGPR